MKAPGCELCRSEQTRREIVAALQLSDMNKGFYRCVPCGQAWTITFHARGHGFSLVKFEPAVTS